MKRYLIIALLSSILFAIMVYLSGCFSISGQPPKTISPINILEESEPSNLVTMWDTSFLFKNTISPSIDKILLKDGEEASIEIRAFQHHFFDSSKVKLPPQWKPTWVLGYVSKDTPDGEETLPGPTIETQYGNLTKIHFKNDLKRTLISDSSKYPFFQYIDSVRGIDRIGKWYPIIYNLKDDLHIRGLADILYPFMKDSIAICGNNKSEVEMASYYGTTVHLHGSNSAWRYDGYPNSHFWANNSDTNKIRLSDGYGGVFGPNETNNKIGLTHYYTNDFPEPNFKGTSDYEGKHGAILWYHDHAMMHTAAHVYAGLLAPYIIKGQDEDKIFTTNYNKNLKNDIYTNRESYGFWRTIWNWLKGLFGYKIEDNDIPLIINDKSFTKSGFLYYNTTADSVNSEGKDGIQPEFFGNTIVVNGKAWPKMPVAGQTYRFRLLNTCSSRTLSLALGTKQVDNTGLHFTEEKEAKCYQIGTESGLMPNRVEITKNNPLTLAPGERADVLIDFGQIEGSKEIALLNFAPNAPFGDMNDLIDLDSLNKIVRIGEDLTNMVMQFELKSVKKRDSDDIKHDLDDLKNNDIFQKITANIDKNRHRKIDLSHSFSLTLKEYTDSILLKNSNYGKLMPNPKIYPIVLMNGDSWDSEKIKRSVNNVVQDSIKRVHNNSKYEIWKIINNTPDMHPIHIHLNRFEVIGRKVGIYDAAGNFIGEEPKMIDPNDSEIGWKDVVKVPKGQVTYIRIKYKLNPNKNPLYGENSKDDAQFVYHCHILEHEDVSMMRRLVVKQKK